MIQLFNINNYTIDTSKYNSLLHDTIVNIAEQTIADYVGAKYAVSFNSATSAIFLCFLDKNTTVKIPSIIPPVVANALITSSNKIEFYDDVSWVGDSYVLHEFEDYKIVDSAQKLEKNQFAKECNPEDLMIFSFYPTKPVGSCDGGMIVSNDYDKIQYLKELSLNGMSFAKDNWDRKIKYTGYKMYMNSIQANILLNNFNVYSEKINKLDEIKKIYNDKLDLNNSSYHLYRIHTENNNQFLSYMKSNHIQCGIHYSALHLNDVYSEHSINKQILPLSEKESKTTVSIPYHEQLQQHEINHIVRTIQNYAK
jgi:perosamine synthetase